MHFDAAGVCVVNCAMFPIVQIEIRAEFAVRARQQIQIELRGHALARRCMRARELPGLFADRRRSARPPVFAADLANASQKIESQRPARNFQWSNRENRQLCAPVCAARVGKRNRLQDNRRRPAEFRDRERVCERARRLLQLFSPKYRPEHRRPDARDSSSNIRVFVPAPVPRPISSHVAPD